MSLFGAAYWKGGSPPFPKICHTHLAIMKVDTSISYLNQVQKTYKYVTHPLSSAKISIYNQKSAAFVISRSKDINCILIHNFQFFWLFLIFKSCFNKPIFIMSAKLATPGLLKIKPFKNKAYDIITSIHDITNKILLHDSNYMVDVVM